MRVASFHGRDDVASLAVRGRGALSAPVLARLLERVHAAGYREVVTNALAPAAQLPFVDLGFEVRGRLRVLAHDFAGLPPPAGATRRARRTDRTAILDVDRAAFDEFWRLDDAGLREAARATPSAQLRVTRAGVDGYVLVGRAACDGYVQRLAVRPGVQRTGLGRALLADGLHWLRDRGALRAYVNTQDDNARAFDLYCRAGFRPLPVGLCVLGRSL